MITDFMPLKKWKEVKADSGRIKWNTPGMVVTGVLLRYELHEIRDAGRTAKAVYIEVDEKEKYFYITVKLQSLLKQVQPNSEVKITYLGEVKGKMKNFEVMIPDKQQSEIF
jgi:hypothetical protein